MFPGLETGFGNGIMCGSGSGNADDIDLFQKVRQVVERPRAELTADERRSSMVVIDDTDDAFSSFELPAHILRQILASLHPGGRIEIITLIESQHGKFDFAQLITDAGFKPVRILSEVKGLRFLEGLRPNS